MGGTESDTGKRNILREADRGLQEAESEDPAEELSSFTSLLPCFFVRSHIYKNGKEHRVPAL